VHAAAKVPPCAPFLRNAWCKPNATITTTPMMFGYSQLIESPHTPFLPPTVPFPRLSKILQRSFLCVDPLRGYGWLGCGAPSGSNSYGKYVCPPQLELDYGEPIGGCSETGHGDRFMCNHVVALVEYYWGSQRCWGVHNGAGSGSEAQHAFDPITCLSGVLLFDSTP
jgi:hypothetical protein